MPNQITISLLRLRLVPYCFLNLLLFYVKVMRFHKKKTNETGDQQRNLHIEGDFPLSFINGKTNYSPENRNDA